jgi:hypothetical protein
LAKILLTPWILDKHEQQELFKAVPERSKDDDALKAELKVSGTARKVPQQIVVQLSASGV